jgi:hypothetical protein
MQTDRFTTKRKLVAILDFSAILVETFNRQVKIQIPTILNKSAILINNQIKQEPFDKFISKIFHNAGKCMLSCNFCKGIQARQNLRTNYPGKLAYNSYLIYGEIFQIV